jgi:hypothetical protein
VMASSMYYLIGLMFISKVWALQGEVPNIAWH